MRDQGPRVPRRRGSISLPRAPYGHLCRSSKNLFWADDWDDSYHLFLTFIKMESSEETPLLPSVKNLEHEQVYKRFGLARKRGILAIVSLVGLIPRTYLSNISQIESANTEMMHSFCRRNFHSFYTPNCERPRFDRTRRRVNIKYFGLSQTHDISFSLILQACREHFNTRLIFGFPRRLVLFHFL